LFFIKLILIQKKSTQMKKTILSTVLFLMISAVTYAAGFEGTWLTKVKIQDGNELELTYVFKTEGEKVTGSMKTPNGDMPVTNVKVDGKNISFEMSFGDQSMKYAGTLKDDDTITLKMIDSPMGDMEMTLKRQK